MSKITFDFRGRDLALVPGGQTGETFSDKALPDAVRQFLVPDARAHCWRAKPIHFATIRQALLAAGIAFEVAFETLPALPFETRLHMQSRPYQQTALAKWQQAHQAGVVVLPTGAGKTLVAALAIHATAVWTLVVVPTLDLLNQWQAALVDALSIEPACIGIFGGGARELQPITIITYDSAVLYPRELRRFGLLIFDECHHLPAPTYRQIAERAFTPLRLGLSATPERSDRAHEDLDVLIGPQVYRRSPAELTHERYLAQYREQRIAIALSPEDEACYTTQRQIYRTFLQRRHIFIRTPEDFQHKLIYLSARDPEARSALLAWRQARTLAMNAPRKYAEIERLLQLHAADQVLLFSEYNQVVAEISRRFCLPSITYKTPGEERRAILARFRSGQYTKLVSGRVLNEGVDLPDCRVAIIVSGNSTPREYIQRLGRVLRPKEGEALLYELITSGTVEEQTAQRRRS
ncbi:MAG TPA: DEAD/DEAH box helicase [Ktedonobacteraceae bacterium]